MKFTVSSYALSKQLIALNGVIINNPVIPILENFLFEIDQGRLKITASDLQTSIITELPIETQDQVKIAIPARIVLDTLRNLPEQPITFHIHENAYSIEIHSDNGRYTLAGENATDFPQIAAVKNHTAMNISAAILKKAIQQAIIATSNDELRPAMNGIYVNFNEKGAVFVATDGHRLVRYTRADVNTVVQHPAIIPRKTLTLLNGLLPNDKQEVKVAFDTSSVHFQLGSINMISKLIDETYPDYENVIPQHNSHQLTISRSRLLASLKRVTIYANRTTHQVRLALTNNRLQILAEDLDFSNKADEHLDCEYEGNTLEIGFNARLLTEMLNSLAAEVVVVHFGEPNRAAIITPQEKEAKEDILLLIMPVILT